MVIVRYCLRHPSIDFCWFDDVDLARKEARELPGATLHAYTYEDEEAAEPILIRRVLVPGQKSF